MADTFKRVGYAALLVDRGFASFLSTQFLGAFNDNVFKMIVSVAAVELAANERLGARYLALASAIFVLPFLLFAGYAGQIADRFSKTRVLQVTKAFEILIMLLGIGALSTHSINLSLAVLFLLAMQASLFSPAKYGILPEMLDEAQISRANGLLEFSTFAAIILGTSGGSLLFARWNNQSLVMGGMLLGIAVLGSLASLFIPKVRASGGREPFAWNPLSEVWAGTKRIYEERPLWLTVAGISYFWLLGALFQLNVVLLGKETLHLSGLNTGLLVTALAVGIGVGSLAAGWLSGNHIEVGLVPAGAALLAVCSILLGNAHTFLECAFWLTAAGFAGGLFIVPLNAFLQESGTAQERGRLLATNGFWNAIGIVLASGVLYLLHDLAHWSPSNIFLALGAATLVSTAYIAWIVPAAVVRGVVWVVIRIFFRVRVVGASNIPLKGGALIVSNHVTYADAILIGCTTPRFIRFLMWQPLFENKWLNPVCRLFQAIPLPTNAPKESLRALRNCRTEIENGQLACIFPEGELTRTSQVKPFERGVEIIARGLGATPIIPVYLHGLWGHALSMKNGRPFGVSRLRLRHEVTIYIGEPICGPVTAEQLHQRVLELGSDAAECSKDETSTLAHRFIASAKKNWSSVALTDSTNNQRTFGETLTAALLLKKWLLRRAPASKCIGLLFPASTAGAIANLGVTLAGGTAVNLNFTAGEESMRHMVDRSSIKMILSSRVFLEKANLSELPGTVFLEDVVSRFARIDKLIAVIKALLLPVRFLAKRAKPDHVAAVIFSSGSTGTPKGVMLSHWNVLSNVEATAQVYTVDNADCMLGVLPFFHSFGYSYTLWFPLLNGFKTVFHSNPTDAQTIGELAESHHATLLLSTPTFCLGYLRRCTPKQFASLRYLLVGAEKLRPSLASAFHEKFAIMPLEGYGCTEMAPVIAVNGAVNPEGTYKAGSVGRPLPNITAQIVDPETLQPLPQGHTGLLLVRGPSRMVGYLNDRERTEGVFHDGFYVTGDLACLDSDGFLHIVDRLSRFSKIGGEMVPHIKIENALSELVGDGNCLVTGVPDERRGERLAVLFVGRETKPVDMIAHLETQGMTALWIPKRNQFYQVERIPVLGSGKVDLMTARAIALGHANKETVCQ